jgi:hypothetical protein
MCNAWNVQSLVDRLGAMDASKCISESLRKAKLCELFRRRDKAEECYRELMDRYPSDFRAFFNCARLLSEAPERQQEALTLFRTVISIEPCIVDAYGAVAGLLIKHDRPVEAADACRRGLHVQPKDKTCMYNINVALRQANCIHEAVNLSWQKLVDASAPRVGLADFTMQAYDTITAPALTIVCVKWGNKYGPEYVNNLYAGVLRHTSASYQFQLVCFTDDSAGINHDVHCLRFSSETTSWQGWWVKAQIFASGHVSADWTLYIDLDTVVCGSLDFVYDLIDTGDHNTKFYTLSVASFRNEGKMPPANTVISRSLSIV